MMKEDVALSAGFVTSFHKSQSFVNVVSVTGQMEVSINSKNRV